MRDAEALLEEAESLLDARQLESALTLFFAAEKMGASPDRCAAGRWMLWMLQGDFERAWLESDAIRLRQGEDPHRFWTGEDISGKTVVLRCLHGLGDTVQMLRFAPRLAKRCSALIVEVPPRMLELAPCFAGVEQVITWGALAPAAAPVWDAQMEIMELPYWCRLKQSMLPMASQYLRVPSKDKLRVSSAMGVRRRPRVGLVWAAGEWNPSRTLPLEYVSRLVAISGCEFWSLQGGEEQKQWKDLGCRRGHRDAAELGAGLVRLAAVIEQLDLVITVDTLAAHLAGALGRPAWVLLQHAADWRWMVDRSDSPWYPSMKLYRQHRQGDWESLLADVEKDLARWLVQERQLERAG